MTAYEAMLKSKEDAVSIMTVFCMAIINEITDEKIPEELREALRVKIAMITYVTLNSEVEEMDV